jgi:hypothetical protein
MTPTWKYAEIGKRSESTYLAKTVIKLQIATKLFKRLFVTYKSGENHDSQFIRFVDVRESKNRDEN